MSHCREQVGLAVATASAIPFSTEFNWAIASLLEQLETGKLYHI